MEVGTLHFYDFQTIHAINRTFRITLKGINTKPQYS